MSQNLSRGSDTLVSQKTKHLMVMEFTLPVCEMVGKFGKYRRINPVFAGKSWSILEQGLHFSLREV